METLISIVVPAYDQGLYIDDCLNSIFQSTYKNWECIIVNDGSKDNTEEKVRSWVEKDSRFKYFFKENSGVCDTKNFGIEKAHGKWILPLDADDKISPDYLELATEHFTNDELKIIYCQAEYFEGLKGKWNLPEFTLEEFAYRNIIFNSAFFRKSDWEKTGGYDKKLIYGMEDWDFWISILKTGGKVKKIDKTCFYYRIKSGSRSASLNREKYTHCLSIIDKKHIDFFQEYLPSYHRILYDNRDLKKVLNSKKYKFMDKFLKIIGRL